MSSLVFVFVGAGLSIVEWKENPKLNLKFINYLFFLLVWPTCIFCATYFGKPLWMGIAGLFAWLWGIAVMILYSNSRMLVEMSVFTNSFLTLYFFTTRYANCLIHTGWKNK